MAYFDIAKGILNESIKSAVYIDENAKEFGSSETSTDSVEERLSLDLYKNFRESGVCLEPIKYQLNKEDDENWINYCLNNRDLILLDWHLDNQSGEIQSLKILDKIINTPSINFCVIYTSEDNLDSVLKRILTNYSDFDPDTFSEYKEYVDTIFDDDTDLSDFHEISLGRNDPKIRKQIKSLLKKNRTQIEEFKRQANIDNSLCAIYKISATRLDAFHKELRHPLPCPNYIDAPNHLIEINNTIIAIFKKRENNPENILGNFHDRIIKGLDSFNQLLIIDFFNRIKKEGVMIKDNNLNFSKDALLEHRAKLKGEGFEDLFDDFIKELLFEKVNLSLRNSKSPLLSEEIFEELYNRIKEIKNEDRRKMNVFYNSSVLAKKGGYINFGDVFKFINEDKYLICLTPLCDCLRPQEKTKRNYFFAKGEHVSLDEALKLGDTAFISYLPNKKVVGWTEVPSEATKHVPIYIKPIQYKVLESQDQIDEENKIKLYYLNKDGEVKPKEVQYITTVRQNYAQRISNHAFSYPLRVGVDFVKIN